VEKELAVGTDRACQGRCARPLPPGRGGRGTNETHPVRRSSHLPQHLGHGLRRKAQLAALDALDALAGLCATLDVPDLSSIFWSQETVELSELGSPDAHMPRWESIKDKEAEELRCHRNTSWPPASSV
jgi:hypothetical protein